MTAAPTRPAGRLRARWAALALAAVLVLGGCRADRSANQPRPPGTPANLSWVLTVTERGDLAPDFSWKAPDGAAATFDGSRGTLTLVNFWATWCAPCRRELPDLVELSRQYAGRGFAVVGIATDRTSNAAELVTESMKKYGIPYQVLLSTQDLEDAFRNIRMMPTSFLVDREGRIVSTIIGSRTKAQFEELILQHL